MNKTKTAKLQTLNKWFNVKCSNFNYFSSGKATLGNF